MLHCKHLITPLSFKRKVVAVATPNNLTSINHRPLLLPKLPGFLSMDDVTRSQPLPLASTAAKASQNNTIDPHPKYEGKKVKGRVVLMKKNVLDLNDLTASVLDRVGELVGKVVSLQLISSVNGDPDVPGEGRIHFVCNSWVYPADKYKKDRVFFANKTYLSSDTPKPLQKFREEELVNLRGDDDDKTRELQEWDRVYDYAYYNDLGNPDKGQEYARPVLGGSSEFPYPRRGRTGRPPTKTDPNTESQLKLVMSLNIYVPTEERFGPLKLSDLLAYGLKTIPQVLKPELKALLVGSHNEFNNMQEVLKLYEGGIELPDGLLKYIRDSIHEELFKELFRTDGEKFLKFPVPQVIQDNKSAWRTDEEFAREMLAGVNPVAIRRLQEFPPASKLDQKAYGDQTSQITKEHIEHNLKGLSVDEAIKNKKLFILDHHDALMPYLRRINTTSTKTYSSRTLLFLENDGTLKPLAIELSLPHPDGDQFGCISKVYTPSSHGVKSSIWQLAKAYVNVNDSGHHQLISHWLKTHAVIEPFVIAANRQLSVLHPIHKLLHPHFRETMNANAIAREVLTNAGGIIEETVFPSKFSMEWSSVMYKNWVFPEQALPVDLIKRGMAVEDRKSSQCTLTDRGLSICC
ncbi:putative linoleate 9S-lipoxygenase 5 [Prunus yedoensis var. nudiflora]|uniref:Lipoxygenase n=1 Tax=Prunus yedoensis var. nudiflora TaxID=2094558 RepID=A0A314ZXI4_PRUYE|nr:putative linoleate 9S-lipoxygenase 5 [Prunus yedoensis var. nudiflora]